MSGIQWPILCVRTANGLSVRLLLLVFIVHNIRVKVREQLLSVLLLPENEQKLERMGERERDGERECQRCVGGNGRDVERD